MRETLLIFLAPGMILIVGGALLGRVAETVAISLYILGVLVLIGWPLTAVIVNVRISRCQERGQQISSGLARAQSAIETASAIIMTIVVPCALIGWIGVYCLVTAADDPEDAIFKTVVGFGTLLVLVAYLAIFVLGRSKTILRMMGVAVLVFGVIVLVGVTQVFIDGEAGLRSGSGLVGGIIMAVCGLWLAITGRTSWSRRSAIDPAGVRHRAAGRSRSRLLPGKDEAP